MPVRHGIARPCADRRQAITVTGRRTLTATTTVSCADTVTAPSCSGTVDAARRRHDTGSSVDGVGPLLDPDAADVVLTVDGRAAACAIRGRLAEGSRRSARHHASTRSSTSCTSTRVRRNVRRLHRAPRLPRRSRRQRDRADAGASVRPDRQLLGLHAARVGRGAPAVRGRATTPPPSWRRWSRRRTTTGIEVWLDVVFNHTGEGDPPLPTLVACVASTTANAYRAPRRRHVQRRQRLRQRHRSRRSQHPAASCWTALERFADLGIDGFRFDLASLLTRDGGGLVEQITEWGRRARRDARSPKPWDLGRVPGR